MIYQRLQGARPSPSAQPATRKRLGRGIAHKGRYESLQVQDLSHSYHRGANLTDIPIIDSSFPRLRGTLINGGIAAKEESKRRWFQNPKIESTMQPPFILQTILERHRRPRRPVLHRCPGSCGLGFYTMVFRFIHPFSLPGYSSHIVLP